MYKIGLRGPLIPFPVPVLSFLVPTSVDFRMREYYTSINTPPPPHPHQSQFKNNHKYVLWRSTPTSSMPVTFKTYNNQCVHSSSSTSLLFEISERLCSLRFLCISSSPITSLTDSLHIGIPGICLLPRPYKERLDNTERKELQTLSGQMSRTAMNRCQCSVMTSKPPSPRESLQLDQTHLPSESISKHRAATAAAGNFQTRLTNRTPPNIALAWHQNNSIDSNCSYKKSLFYS